MGWAEIPERNQEFEGELWVAQHSIWSSRDDVGYPPLEFDQFWRGVMNFKLLRLTKMPNSTGANVIIESCSLCFVICFTWSVQGSPGHRDPDTEAPGRKTSPERGISLFRRVPRSRTCTDAGIMAHWCACLEWKPLDANSSRAKSVAQAVVDAMNDYNMDHIQLLKPALGVSPSLHPAKCAKWFLRSVNWAAEYTNNKGRWHYSARSETLPRCTVKFSTWKRKRYSGGGGVGESPVNNNAGLRVTKGKWNHPEIVYLRWLSSQTVLLTHREKE